jgi:hypothetical protein
VVVAEKEQLEQLQQPWIPWAEPLLDSKKIAITNSILRKNDVV